MYAVIRSGGKQYRVEEGDVLRVERLPVEAGAKVVFDEVLLAGEGADVKAGAEAAGFKVSAVVEGHGRGRKIVVFKKRRRKNYRRTLGHRQPYTLLRITGIHEDHAEEREGA